MTNIVGLLVMLSVPTAASALTSRNLCAFQASSTTQMGGIYGYDIGFGAVSPVRGFADFTTAFSTLPAERRLESHSSQAGGVRIEGSVGCPVHGYDPASARTTPPESFATNTDTRPKGGRTADLPAKGEPNSSGVRDDGNGKGQIRDYGTDGKAETDYDFGHDHGAGDPHAHDWDWTKTPPRQPGRPIRPGEGARR